MSTVSNGLQNAVAYKWEYADATARAAATGFVTADVGSLARQLDNDSLWLLTATTPTWAAVTGGAASGALLATNNLSDVTSASTARTNLGLGTAAVKDTGTGSGNVILGNDSRLTDARTPTSHHTSHNTGGTDAIAPSDIGAAAASHTHTHSDVSDWAEAVQDTVGAAIVAGTNVTVTYDDTAGTITIDSTGGGGGGGMTNPMTTAGDLILGGSSGTPGRLGKGSDGTILTVDGTSHLPAWATNAPAWGNVTGIPSTFSPSAHASSHATGGSDPITPASIGATTNPMTTQDDLVVGGASGAPARLAKGSDSQVLTVDPTTHHLVWATPSSGFADPTTTKGDLIVHGSSTTRLPVGSDNYVLTADSTQAAGMKWAAASGGGSGNTTYTSAIASPPSSPTNGDQWWPSDGGGLRAVRVSSAWQWYYNQMPITLPVDSDYSWNNQVSGVTKDAADGSVYLYAPANSSDSWSMRLKTLPSTPYTIKAYLDFSFWDVSTVTGGLILRNSSTGDFLAFGQYGSNADPPHQIVDGGSSGNALTTVKLDARGPFTPWPWWAITDDGTTRKYWNSRDGLRWLLFYSHGHTDFTTPNTAGFGLESRNGTYPAALRVLSWHEDTSVTIS